MLFFEKYEKFNAKLKIDNQTVWAPPVAFTGDIIHKCFGSNTTLYFHEKIIQIVIVVLKEIALDFTLHISLCTTL